MNSPRCVRRLALAAFISVLASAAHAERLPLRQYTTADGLARDSVARVVQDSRGFIWFCTYEGLSRFDGYSFTNFGRADGLPGLLVATMLEGRDGTYWIGTNEGLARLESGQAR